MRLGEPVQAVDWKGGGVAITTPKGQWKARMAIVTLPLGVLQSGKVRFDPPLPSAQKQALSGLRMGLLNKLVVTFPQSFWPSDYQHFANLSEDIGVMGEIMNLKNLFGHPALLLFLAGTPAWKRESWNDQRLAEEAETLLARLFRKPARHQRVLATRWGQDPFALGSYSYLPVGASPALREQMAHPQPPLFFAGEATHRTLSATVHGAHLSGLRAAAEVDRAWT